MIKEGVCVRARAMVGLPEEERARRRQMLRFMRVRGGVSHRVSTSHYGNRYVRWCRVESRELDGMDRELIILCSSGGLAGTDSPFFFLRALLRAAILL